MPSSLGGAGSRSLGQLVRRDELSELGFYNPIDYGGYMMTVSLSPSSSYALALFSGGSPSVSFPGYGDLAFRDDVEFDD